MGSWTSIRRKFQVLKIYFHILECFYAIFTDTSHDIGIILIVGLSLPKDSLLFKPSESLRVLTRDLISDEMKYFKFGVWSISYSCLLEIPRNETHCGLFWQKWKQYIQMKSSKTNLHMYIFNKVKDSTSKDQNKIASFYFSGNEN